MENISIEDFWVIGINYKNSDTALRGMYAVQDEQYEKILAASPQYAVEEVFVLSTCNRTEIYGFAPAPALLQSLLCDFTSGSKEDFNTHAYQKRGKAAIGHIFNVAAGLDSQILGDYEIVGQLKRAVHFAQDKGRIGIFTDRLFKSALQACRDIRSKTKLSTGTVSVAYASVLFLKEHLDSFEGKKVLIIGLGKIGRNACKNLLDILPGSQIMLMNRTEEKALALAQELKGVSVLPFERKSEAVKTADIIIVATNATLPVLEKADLEGLGKKVLLDLSVPNNINSDVTSLPDITLANVDDLSQINDRTLQMRADEIPQAKAFITYHIHQFAEWYLMRRNVPVLKAVKQKLSELNHNLDMAKYSHEDGLMQKVINDMAQKMKTEGLKSGCYYIEAINGYLTEVGGSLK